MSKKQYVQKIYFECLRIRRDAANANDWNMFAYCDAALQIYSQHMRRIIGDAQCAAMLAQARVEWMRQIVKEHERNAGR